MFILSGNNSEVADKLLRRMVKEKNGREEEVGKSLRLLMCDLVNTEELDPDNMEQLPICLAKRRYFLLFEWTKSAVKILISMTRGKVQDCLMEQDEDCFLSKLCWDIGPSSNILEIKQSLLQLSLGSCVCWSHDFQENEGL